MKTPYTIHSDVKFKALELIDVKALERAAKEQWSNQTLCEVNDSVVRLGVLKGEFHWHKHDREDEFFYVVEGRFYIDLEGRTVYVVSSKPSEANTSAYTKVLSYVDKKTCVVLKSESFEVGDRLRKVLTAKLEPMYTEKGVNAPAEVEMNDVRDQTRTLVAIEDLEVDGQIDSRSFEVSELGRHCR